MGREIKGAPVAQARTGGGVMRQTGWGKRRGSAVMVMFLSLVLAACGDITAPMGAPSVSTQTADWKRDGSSASRFTWATSLRAPLDTLSDAKPPQPVAAARRGHSNYAIAY